MKKLGRRILNNLKNLSFNVKHSPKKISFFARASECFNIVRSLYILYGVKKILHVFLSEPGFAGCMINRTFIIVTAYLSGHISGSRSFFG